MLPDKEQLPKLTREGVDKCFGCGQSNPVGLKLHFHCDTEKAEADFVTGEWHQGWPGIVHGGIIYSLLDEAMGYAVFPLGVNCLTAKSEIIFKHPAPIGETLHLTGIITKKTRRLIQTAGTITLPDGTIVAEGTALMYVTNQEQER